MRKNKGMMNSQQAKENFDRYSVYLGVGDVLLEDDFISLVGEDLAQFIKNIQDEKGLYYKIPAPWGGSLTLYTFKGYLRAVRLINIAELYDCRGELPPLPDNVVIFHQGGGVGKFGGPEPPSPPVYSPGKMPETKDRPRGLAENAAGAGIHHNGK